MLKIQMDPEGAPHWLSPEGRGLAAPKRELTERSKAIAQKHRDKWLARQKAKRMLAGQKIEI